MPFSRYTADDDGAFTFYDDDAGTALRAAGPAAQQRAQELDAMATPMSAGGLPPVPPKPPADYLAAAPPVTDLGDMGDVPAGGAPLPPPPRPKPQPTAADAAALAASGARVEAAVRGKPAGAAGAFRAAPTRAPAQPVELGDVDATDFLTAPGPGRVRQGTTQQPAPIDAATGKPIDPATGRPVEMTAQDHQAVAAATGGGGRRIGIGGGEPQAEEPQQQLTQVGQTTMQSGSSSSSTSSFQRSMGPEPEAWKRYEKATRKAAAYEAQLVQAQAEASTAIADAHEEMRYHQELQAAHMAGIDAETEERLAPINARMEAAMQAYQNGKVDPDHFWKEGGTSREITAAIAIALGAIGQGLRGTGENEGLKIIQQRIDRDIQLQMHDLDKKRGEVGMLAQIGREVIAQGGDRKMAESAMRATAIQAVQAKIGAIAARADAAMGSDGVSIKSRMVQEQTERMAAREWAEVTERMRGQVSGQSTRQTQSQVSKTRNDYEKTDAPDTAAGKPTFVLEDENGNIVRHAIRNDKGVDPKEITDRAGQVSNLFAELRNLKKLYNKKLLPGQSPQFENAVLRASQNISQLQKMGVLGKDETDFVERTHQSMREGGDVIDDAFAYARRAHANIVRQTDAVPVKLIGTGKSGEKKGK